MTGDPSAAIWIARSRLSDLSFNTATYHNPLGISRMRPAVARREAQGSLFAASACVHNGIVGAIRERTHRVVLVAILPCIEREYLVLHVLIATEVTIVPNLSVVVCQPSKVNLS